RSRPTRRGAPARGAIWQLCVLLAPRTDRTTRHVCGNGRIATISRPSRAHARPGARFGTCPRTLSSTRGRRGRPLPEDVRPPGRSSDRPGRSSPFRPAPPRGRLRAAVGRPRSLPPDERPSGVGRRMALRIEQVEGRRGVARFIDVPYRLHEPGRTPWVPPL